MNTKTNKNMTESEIKEHYKNLIGQKIVDIRLNWDKTKVLIRLESGTLINTDSIIITK